MATRTTTDHGDVLLVGSIARLDDDWTVEDVFRRSAAALGDHVTMLPDGELGDRSQWITFIARHTYYGHPDLETRSRHTYDDWLPKGYDDQWRFAVREGVDEIRFERIGYAAEAERSYEIFKRLRDEGAIPEGMRFLVAYPLTESAVRAFVNEPRDYEIIWRAYNDAVRRELEHLGTVIPPEDLAIQWDLARETAMIEKVGFNFDDSELTSLPKDPMERYLDALSDLSPSVPDGAWLGLHVCYGSLQHKEGESPDSAHYTPIRDLGTAVEMLNRGVVACGRRVDFVHMPVQLADKRDGHYAPLDRPRRRRRPRVPRAARRQRRPGGRAGAGRDRQAPPRRLRRRDPVRLGPAARVGEHRGAAGAQRRGGRGDRPGLGPTGHVSPFIWASTLASCAVRRSWPPSAPRPAIRRPSAA